MNVSDSIFEKIKKVLEYYADAKRYQSRYSLKTGYIPASILMDRGRTAQNLLLQLQRQSEGERQ